MTKLQIWERRNFPHVKSKREDIVNLRTIRSEPIKPIHTQNVLPDFSPRLPILVLISDKMPSWRQFLPYVWRLKKSLQCQLLLKSYHPSSLTDTHMYTHCNAILTQHLCGIMWVWKMYFSLISVWLVSVAVFIWCKPDADVRDSNVHSLQLIVFLLLWKVAEPLHSNTAWQRLSSDVR